MGLDFFFLLLICFPLNVAFLASTFYQGLFSTLCLFTCHWIMFLMAVPVTCYHVMLYVKRQHLIDVTEVFRELNAEKKFRIVKLVYYITMLIITVFRLVLIGIYYLDAEDE